MLELASLGAKVLQSRSVEFAARYRVPVEVKSSFTEEQGTLVATEDADMEGVTVAGVTGDRNQAKITIVGVPDRPGVAARVFGRVAEANILVDMIIQNVGQGELTDISFTVPRADLGKSVDLVQRVVKDIEAKSMTVTDSIAKVSLVGVGMRTHSGVAAKMFQVLSEEGINIQMISTSEIKISCVIDEKYLELAIRTLHAAFRLDEPPVFTVSRRGV
jgi:aspartate kinase